MVIGMNMSVRMMLFLMTTCLIVLFVDNYGTSLNLCFVFKPFKIYARRFLYRPLQLSRS
jgi:hypothetical protein